jgi:hypothetical protein
VRHQATRQPTEQVGRGERSRPPLLQTSAAVAATVATAAAVVVIAPISAIMPAAVVAAVVLVLPPKSLPLPLLVDCCLLFVSTAVVNRIIKLIVIVRNDVWYLPKYPEFEYGCLVNIRGSIVYFFTIPEDYLIQLLLRLSED